MGQSRRRASTPRRFQLLNNLRVPATPTAASSFRPVLHEFEKIRQVYVRLSPCARVIPRDRRWSRRQRPCTARQNKSFQVSALLENVPAVRALFLYPFVQEVGPVGWGSPVYTRPPMKIIISVKWTSLTERRRLAVDDRR